MNSNKTVSMFLAREGQFKGAGRARIFWQCWPAENHRAALVIAHGLGEHGGRYHRLASSLLEHGISVFALDFYGHGKSSGRRGVIRSFANCGCDLDQFLSEQVLPLGLPTYVYGQDLGGTVALDFALSHPSKLEGLIVCAPFYHTQFLSQEMMLVVDGLSTFVPNAPGYRVDPALLTRSEAEVDSYRKDKLNFHDSYSVKAVTEVIGSTVEVRERIGQLRHRLLVLHGEEDGIVSPESSRRLVADCGVERSQLIVYPGLYHQILNERSADRRRVVEDILSWLQRTFGSGADD